MEKGMTGGKRRKAKELYQELDAFFQPAQYEDLAANGLLADHTEWIEKVYTATFSGRQVIEKLREAEAENCLLFTHHPGAQHPEGLPAENFSDEDRAFMQKKGISHYSLHLPLDQVSPYSTGISLARALGIFPYHSFFEEGGAVMGLYCSTEWKTSADVRLETEKLMGHDCRLYAYSEERLQDGKIALIAGGAEGTEIYPKLREAGIRLLLTGVGNPKIDWFAPSHEAARQAGVSILAAGHYSTEQFAPQAMFTFFLERGVDAVFLSEAPHLTDL